jgi:hypothetical protein
LLGLRNASDCGRSRLLLGLQPWQHFQKRRDKSERH